MINLKELNEILGDINNFRYRVKPLQKTQSYNGVGDDDYNGSQCEYNETQEIYPLSDKETFLQITIRTDSYGDNEFIHGIKFVKPTEKVIVNYQAI